ncbi:MAG: ABC transporter permease [Ruminococcus sp.]|nr:ABC transporter permease [Ruminococcus sp.]
MSSMFYAHLAVQGMRKNGKIYLPYILTSVGIVMMYYIVSYLTYSKSLYNMTGGRDMQMILSWGTGVIAVFSFIFLLYTNSFVMRRRKKEFGLYNILGMGKKNIASILIWETLITFLSSVIAGLGLGILLSKLSELCTAKMLGENISLGFTIEKQAIINSILLFGAVFLLILLNSLRQIHTSKPIELLHSDKGGEKPPKAKWLLAFIGLIILGVAYYISCTIRDPMSALLMFFVAVIMVIVATYILFTVGSVTLCKMLQKNKRYYYKTEHFVSISSMSYRMKRNGASLASICILSTMVLVMISSTLCLYIGKEDSIHNRYPREIAMETYSIDEQYTNAIKGVSEKIVENHNLSIDNLLYYNCLPVAGTLGGSIMKIENTGDYSKLTQLYVFTIDEYNRLMNKNETLENDEIIMYTNKSDYMYHEFTIDGFQSLKIKEQVDEFNKDIVNDSSALSVPVVFIFVSDVEQLNKIYDFQLKQYGDNASLFKNYYGFNLNCEDNEETAIFDEICDEISNLQLKDENFPSVKTDSVIRNRESFYSMFGGIFFLGILLSVVFIFAAVLIMYYKQITEGYEDADKFEIMQKVGMTKQEIKKSINSQVLTVFFAPLITAGIHTGFAFPILLKLLRLFGLCNTPLLIGITAGSFAVFAIFYVLVYKITSISYYKIVSKQ